MQVDIRQAIVTNWPIKVTALALAAVLWAALSAEEPATQFIPVRIEIQTPAELILAQEVPQVQGRFGGPAAELIKLYSDPPVITKVIPDSVTEFSVTLELTPQDVVLPPGVEVTLDEILPRRIDVTLDEVTRRSVRVVSRVNIDAASGFVVMGSRLLPDSVTIFGPDALVNRIGTVYTVPLDLLDVRSTTRRTVAIDTTALGVVSLSQPEVEVEARIQQLTQRRIGGVPVVIAGGVWGSEPATVQVTVRGPAARLGDLTRDSLLVSAPAATTEGEMVALSVRPPTGLTATVSPDSVRATRIIQ
jgi:hypothetical protein